MIAGRSLQRHLLLRSRIWPANRNDSPVIYRSASTGCKECLCAQGELIGETAELPEADRTASRRRLPNSFDFQRLVSPGPRRHGHADRFKRFVTVGPKLEISPDRY